MPLMDLVQDALQTLSKHYQSNKLLLIHPSSRYRNLLVAGLIDNPPGPLFYFSLGLEDADLDQFLASLSHALADQSPGFGRKLSQARNQSPGDPEALAQALGEDLDGLASEDYLLILDEFDRVDKAPDIQELIQRLLDYLPAQCHLMINSRSLPRLPWVALVARHEAVVLRDAKMLTSGFYAEYTGANPNVEVYALGPGYVMINGQHVDTWEGHLPRLLFFFALDRPLVTRADICEAFWPELPLDQAVNVFHVTKRRLHKALGFDVLVHEGGHYRVNSDLNLQYDVEEFVGYLVEARAADDPEEADAFWRDAIEMYRGNYLQAHEDPWIVERRGDFREGYLEALVNRGAYAEERGDDEAALGWYLRAATDAYQREDLHREVIRLYGKLGRRAEAAEHYQRLEADYEERYGMSPSPETRAVYGDVTGG